MKKFLFIIPKVYCYVSAVTFIIICVSSKLNAQVYGCDVIVGSSHRLFYTPYGAGSPLEWQTVLSGAVTTSGETGGYRSDGSITYGCISDIGGICAVYQQYEISAGPPQVVGMRVYRTGIYASISPINCPLDDYLPVFITFVGCLGFLQLRRLTKSQSSDEGIYYHSSI